MKGKYALILAALALSLGIMALLGGTGVWANHPQQGGVPLLISYQGRLTDQTTGNLAPDGAYNMTFAIYAAQTGGSALWTETYSGPNAVQVSGGLFNVLLGSLTALSASVFDGTERWLELTVSGTALPRQRLASVPYAIQAANADTVDGQHASELGGAHYHHVLVVAKSGGDYTTIGAALAAITDSGPASRYLVRVMPGTYSETVRLKPYVHLQGSGQGVSIIFANVAAYFAPTMEATVVMTNYASLTDLTVTTTGPTATVAILSNNVTTGTIRGVTAQADQGGWNIGIANFQSSLAILDSTATATGGNVAWGLYNSHSSPLLQGAKATASGASDINAGIYNENSSPTIAGGEASGSGGTTALGVYNMTSSPQVYGLRATASGGTTNLGIDNFDSSAPLIWSSKITASGGTSSYGVRNTAGSTPTILNSDLQGGVAALYTDATATGTTVGGSLLRGGAGGSGYMIVNTGLDADTLDGVHASAFATTTHTHSGSDITSAVLSATQAATATYALNAGALEGQPASAFATAIHAHSGAEIASGKIDNARLNTGPGNGLDTDTVDGFHASQLGGGGGTPNYEHVLIVAGSGGNYTTINAALAAITGSGPDNRYLIWVAPGTYTEAVTLKPYVHLQGAGPDITIITSTVSSSGTPVTATVVMTNYSRLSELTVKAAVSDATKVAAILNRNVTTATIKQVTAEATGGSFAYGIYNFSSSPRIESCIAMAGGGTSASNGIYNSASSPFIEGCTITVTVSGGGNKYGISNDGSSPTIQNTRVEVSGAGSNYGIQNASSSSPTIRYSWVMASGGGISNAIANIGSSPTIINSTVSGGYYGLYNVSSSAPTVASAPTVDGSRIYGSVNSIYNLSSTAKVGASKLDGTVSGSGFTCIASYNTNYAALNTSCQ